MTIEFFPFAKRKETQSCVKHADVHLAKSAADQSKIEFAQAAINLLKNARVNPKNKLLLECLRG